MSFNIPIYVSWWMLPLTLYLLLQLCVLISELRKKEYVDVRITLLSIFIYTSLIPTTRYLP